MYEVVEIFKEQLHQAASEEKRLWWERYLRHSVLFLGVPMPKIRELLRHWYPLHVSNLELSQQYEIVQILFSGMYAEEKLSAVLLLELYLWQRRPLEKQLALYEDVFAKHQIYDWNVDDWFCLKVLAKHIQKDGKTAALRIASWTKSSYLWKARAGLVAFVKHVDNPAYHSLILEGCFRLIVRPERFAKTAVGWILHDLYKVEQQLCLEFVQKNLHHFDNESLRNALKYADKAFLREYLTQHKSIKRV